MDKQAVLDKLQALSIAHETHTHQAVMTCEAQVAALSNVDGVCTKNLFLKDKKGRLYIVTAQADTKVDLKVLSARLGTGKGGVRLAPDELITSVLQVPLGSVTPLAACQPSAAGVALLLDQKLQAQPRIFVHPLVNTATCVISPEGLEAYLRSAGREAVWVDLEAEPTIDRDNPPDLKQYADAAVPLAADTDAGTCTAAGGTTAAPTAAAAAAKPAAAAAGGKKAAAVGGKKGGAVAAAAPPTASQRPDDVLRLTDELVAKIAATLVGGQGVQGVDSDVRRRLTADVAVELNALRNSAYAAGFTAAKGAIAASITGQYA